MDIRTSQELMGMQNNYATKYGHVFKMKETFEETDIKGNNNLFNSLKTEANSNHGHDPSSLFQVKCTKEKKLEVDNALFSYSSFKKAMDLRTHNRTLDGRKRTIFDDAEYFAKNYCYKLLPITFEQVDETIIQSEHNYSLSSLNSDSELEEDCSRTMDYSQIKEKNYKRRRTKFQEEEMAEGGTPGSSKPVEWRFGVQETPTPRSFTPFLTDSGQKLKIESSSVFLHQNEESPTRFEYQNTLMCPETDNSVLVQPLDLSASPLVQEEKTDPHLRERPNSIAGNNEVTQLDSNKENMSSELNGIRVTITRPDEKENYQPCDLFLNDIARLVPWLIDKDCFEIDILDRTCKRHDELQNHRLYYVISESTWRLFQGTNERVILTNDRSLGQPLKKIDKDEKPSYLVFDQFSLAKCLADYCQEIGGCFEYTCVEERVKEEAEEELKKISEAVENTKKVVETVGNVCKDEETSREKNETKEEKEKEKEKEKEDGEEQMTMSEKLETSIEIEENTEERSKKEDEATPNTAHLEKKSLKRMKREVVLASDPLKKRAIILEKAKPKSVEKEVESEKQARSTVVPVKEIKKRGRGFKCKKKECSIQIEPKNLRISTRSRSISEAETSQKSEKPVIKQGRKKREGVTLSKEPPKKRNKPIDPENLLRRTRSGKMLGEVLMEKPTIEIEKNGRPRRAGKRERTKEVEKKKEEEVRKLRSQKLTLRREETNEKSRTFKQKQKTKTGKG